jgi:hypothetical protein
MKFISIGGSCHLNMALKEAELRSEAYPFDSVRSTFEGIIDCINTNFKHFFPDPIEKDILFDDSVLVFRGRYIGFYHHDITNPEIQEAFSRRIKRWNTLLTETRDSIVFCRCIVTEDYETELAEISNFHKIMKQKYPNLRYILCMIIPEQSVVSYIRPIDEKTH